MVLNPVAGYWAVEATEETAMNGVWKKGPGKDLFDVLEKVNFLSSFCSLSDLKHFRTIEAFPINVSNKTVLPYDDIF